MTVTKRRNIPKSSDAAAAGETEEALSASRDKQRSRNNVFVQLCKFALPFLAVALMFLKTAHRSGRLIRGPSEVDFRLPKIDDDTTDNWALSASDLSLAVLVHPGIKGVDTWIANMRRGLTTGRESSSIQKFIVFYDARTKGKRLNRLLRNLDRLVEKDVIQKAVELQWDASFAEILGLREDPHFLDPSLYATYQYLAQECDTPLCAYMNDDVIAYEGGGLGHAIEALRRNAKAVFAVPPLASDFIDFSSSPELNKEFRDGDGKFPYPEAVGRIRVVGSLPQCHEMNGGGMSTRYYVSERKRFLRSLPWPRSTNSLLEQHEHLGYLSVFAGCEKNSATSFLLHPPPWSMGQRLMTKCSIEELQKAVDQPDSLVVDEFNNMLEESWTKACLEYK